MRSKQSTNGDDGNAAFGFPEKVADLKPGFDEGASKRDVKTGDSHRFRPSNRRDVPKGSLADRIAKSRKE